MAPSPGCAAPTRWAMTTDGGSASASAASAARACIARTAGIPAAARMASRMSG